MLAKEDRVKNSETNRTASRSKGDGQERTSI